MQKLAAEAVHAFRRHFPFGHRFAPQGSRFVPENSSGPQVSDIDH
jgi:hypothetical protein